MLACSRLEYIIDIYKYIYKLKICYDDDDDGGGGGGGGGIAQG